MPVPPPKLPSIAPGRGAFRIATELTLAILTGIPVHTGVCKGASHRMGTAACSRYFWAVPCVVPSRSCSLSAS